MHHHSALSITKKSLDAEARRPRVSLRVVDPDRPRTRGDCVDGERPCPWLSCRYHLAVDVQRSGSITINPLLLEDAITDDGLDLARLPETCALHVADRGQSPLRAIAVITGTSFQRVKQVSTVAMARAAKKAGKIGRAEVLALLEEWSDHPGSSK